MSCQTHKLVHNYGTILFNLNSLLIKYEYKALSQNSKCTVNLLDNFLPIGCISSPEKMHHTRPWSSRCEIFTLLDHGLITRGRGSSCEIPVKVLQMHFNQGA